MNIPAEFDHIRPYTPEELPQVYEELIADPAFQQVATTILPYPFEMIAAQMRQCTRQDQELSLHLQPPRHRHGPCLAIRCHY